MAKGKTNKPRIVSSNTKREIEEAIVFIPEDIKAEIIGVFEPIKTNTNIPDTKDIFIKKDMGDSWKFITKDGRKIIIKK